MSEICSECDGIGLVEGWRDIAVRGEHATVEEVGDCEACGGTGRVLCEVCRQRPAAWSVDDGAEPAQLCESCALSALSACPATARRLDGEGVRS